MSKVISFKQKGGFTNTEKFLNTVKGAGYLNKLSEYGQAGVDALAAATPVDSGKTAASWNYEIETTPDAVTVNWNNSNVNRGVNIALILDAGHGTRNGGYVPPRNYIRPAMEPLMNETVDAVWTEVRKA